jgi:hypothetical protein
VRHLFVSHLAVFVIAAAVLRIAVTPAEHCPPFDPGAAKVAVSEAMAWLVGNALPDGRYLYGYDRERDIVSPAYNATRHAGVTMGLYRLAAAGNGSAFAAAEAGLRFIRANLVRREGWTAFSPLADTVQIGATARAVAARAHRRLGTGDVSYDELMRGLSRFLVGQQQLDGSILAAWDDQARRPVADVYAKFGTGEALWALALMHRLFPDEGWDGPARRLAHFVATRRDEVEGYLIPFADHWAAYGLAELGPSLLGPDEVGYARRLAGRLGLSTRLESQVTGAGLNGLVRGDSVSGAARGTIAEGLAQLLRLARADPRLADLAPKLEERLSCTAARIVEHRADAREASLYSHPELVRGAWFSPAGYTQMDDQRHSLTALQSALELLGATPQ